MSRLRVILVDYRTRRLASHLSCGITLAHHRHTLEVIMAPEKSSFIKAQVEDNVFVRLLRIPVVSSTCEVIERSYSSAKQAHPLLCRVLGVYERGARTAGSLAVWSLQPAIQRLETQLVAANSLACKGLDRLEEKIPALQSPPEKLVSGIMEAVATTVQTAKDGIASPVAGASGRVFSVASGGLQLTRSAIAGGFRHLVSSKPVHLAGEGTEAALTLAESLVNYVLPDFSDENDARRGPEADVSAPGPQPIHRRLGALASTTCQRAYKHTALQLQRTKSQGQDLVTRITGVSTLAGFAVKNLEAVGSAGQSVQLLVTGLFSWEEQQQGNKQTTEADPGLLKGGGLQSLASGFAEQLLGGYVSMVSGLKTAPRATLGLARDGLVILAETLESTRERVGNTFSLYGTIRRLTSWEEPTADCSASVPQQKGYE